MAAAEKAAARAKAAGWRYREILANHDSFLGPRRMKRIFGSTYEKNPNALDDAAELLLEAARFSQP